jgi:hypothetical protein
MIPLGIRLKALNQRDSLRVSFDPNIDAYYIDFPFLLVEETLACERPLVNIPAERCHLGFAVSDGFLLSVRLESHDFALPIPLDDGEWNEQVRGVGNAPRRVGQHKACQ